MLLTLTSRSLELFNSSSNSFSVFFIVFIVHVTIIKGLRGIVLPAFASIFNGLWPSSLPENIREELNVLCSLSEDPHILFNLKILHPCFGLVDVFIESLGDDSLRILEDFLILLIEEDKKVGSKLRELLSLIEEPRCDLQQFLLHLIVLCETEEED